MPGYLWTPGYWAYGPMGYYWVPGVWVSPPPSWLLWTPGYWGWANGIYLWHGGYWGPHVGFYGGVNYGFGYGGFGFAGGSWVGGQFRYNMEVAHAYPGHESFNGPGGVMAQPRPEETGLGARATSSSPPGTNWRICKPLHKTGTNLHRSIMGVRV